MLFNESNILKQLKGVLSYFVIQWIREWKWFTDQ